MTIMSQSLSQPASQLPQTVHALPRSPVAEQVYTNYRLLLPDQELLGTLVVREGLIADIQPGITATGQDGGGDYLLPGLVELHTDNLERCLFPRPGVRWAAETAVLAHDRDLVAAGITTVCDAIAIGDIHPGSPRLTHFAPMIDTVLHGCAAHRFVADHRLHLRCELSYRAVVEVVEQYIHHPRLTLLSLMDHAPGQRQFGCLDQFTTYYSGKHGVRPRQIPTLIQSWQHERHQYGAANRRALVRLAQRYGVCLASHDDTTCAHVRQAAQDQVAIAEFPTTLDAARMARQFGMRLVVGAPNIVLGGSQSGNVSALTLYQQDLVDILSSDYAPQSLLQAAFAIARETGHPLYQVIALMTLNPARALGLESDRGSLAIGKQADLVMVHDDAWGPQITAVLRQGRRVA